MNTISKKLRFLVNNEIYNVFLLTFIFFYVSLLGVPFHFPEAPIPGEFYQLSHLIITSLLATDFLFRLIATEKKRNFFKSWPNLLDAAVILLSLLPFATTSYFIIFRALRFILIVALIQKVRNHFTLIARSSIFNQIINALIILYAIFAGIEVSIKLSPQQKLLFNIFDYFLILFFIAEITIKILSEKKAKDFFADGWNIFDFTIVALSILPFEQTMGIAIARIFRILRVVRLFSGLPSLRKIMTALGDSINPILSIILLLVIIFYIYAVIGVHLFGHSSFTRDLWHDVPTAALTLFRVLTFEDWTDVMYSAQEIDSLHWIYFVSFIVITAFVFLNLFTSVILENMVKSQEIFVKQEVKDELCELEGGGNLFNLKNPILLINYDSKLRSVVEILDVIEQKQTGRTALVLTQKKTTEIDRDFENIIRNTKRLSVKFKTANISEPFLRHRYLVYNAHTIIIFIDSDLAESDQPGTNPDTYNIQIFSMLFSDDIFVLKLMEAYLSGHRKNCFIEIAYKKNSIIFREMMTLSVRRMLERLYEKSTSVFENPVAEHLFKNVRELLQSMDLSSTRKASLAREPYFMIVHTSQYLAPIVREALLHRRIFHILRELFFSQNHQILYFPLNSCSARNTLIGQGFQQFLDLVNWGTGIGISYKDQFDGHVRPEIFPSERVKFSKEDIDHANLIMITDSKTNMTRKLSTPNPASDIRESNELIEESLSPYYNILQIGKDLIDCSQFLDCNIAIRETLDDSLITDLTNYDRIVVALEDEEGYLTTMRLLTRIEELKNLDDKQKDLIMRRLLVIFKTRQYAVALEQSPFNFTNTIIIDEIMSQLMVHITNEPELRKLYDDFLITGRLRFAFYKDAQENDLKIENFQGSRKYLASYCHALPIGFVRDDDSVLFGYEENKTNAKLKAIAAIVTTDR
mgnify:CR=1 FL=1